MNTPHNKGRAPRALLSATVAITVRGGLLPWARQLRAHGWQVDALALGVTKVPECIEAFDETWEVCWSRNPLAPRNFLKAVSEVRHVVLRGGYDLVHVHTPVAAFILRYALRNMGPEKPVVIYTAHGLHFYKGGPVLSNFVYRSLEKLAGKWTDYMVTINSEDEEACARYNIVPRDRLIRIPGVGIDHRKFGKHSVGLQQVKEVREELGLAETDKLFLMIAEFNPGKRHADALRALAALDRKDVYLGLAGEGKLMEQTRRLARSLGIESRVRFLGFRRDIPALLRASAALLHPSEREGLPLSIMEAMGLGTLVIATHIRGSFDLLHGGCGFMVPVGDTAALTSAMQAALAEPEGVRKICNRAAERIRGFDIEHVHRLHEALYATALGRPSICTETSLSA